MPLSAAYGMASRLEHLPRWSDLWMASDPVEKRAPRGTFRLRGFLAGIPVESVVRAELESGRTVRWRQAHGTLLHYAAQFETSPTEEGTLVRYHVELDPGIDMLDAVALRRVVVQEVERTLDRMKWSAERERVAEEVRLMKARPASEPPAQPSSPPPPQPAPAAQAEQAPASRRRRRRRRGRASGQAGSGAS